jgi:mRNA interferase HigB
MRVICKRMVNEFIGTHPNAAESLLRWYLICKDHDWLSFSDMRKVLPHADAVGDDLYVFNVGGNKFRVIARIFFQLKLYISDSLAHTVNMIRLSYPTCNWIAPAGLAGHIWGLKS